MIHSQFCSKWNQWEPTSYLFSVIFTLISLSVVYIHTLKDFYSIDKMSKNLRINQFIVFIENKVDLASGMHCVRWQYYVFVTKFLVVLGFWQDNFICKKINIKSPLKSLPENSAWSKNTQHHLKTEAIFKSVSVYPNPLTSQGKHYWNTKEKKSVKSVIVEGIRKDFVHNVNKFQNHGWLIALLIKQN